jgi:glycosyltransferase involved in cell wall biosynthesis
MRLALVHDCIVHIGGAERVLQSLHAVFPDAPVYTLVLNKQVTQQLLPAARIFPSFARKLPGAQRYFRVYAPLYPMAIESFDLAEFDTVLSSSFSFAKGTILSPYTCHICYCHSPLRYLWSEYHFHRRTVFRQWWKRGLVDPFLTYLRMWDQLTADRVDYFIANSGSVRDRIAKYYRRDSEIIHPPVPVRGIPLGLRSDGYYLLVSRLMAYKRVDLAVEAFNRLGLPLKVIGSGPELKTLRKMSRPNIEFLGSVDDPTLRECYSNCRALVFPGFEDFGIVMVEAQAYGKPVVAFASGGASEIVVDRVTGVLFDDQTAASLIDAIKELERLTLVPEEIRRNALRFDEGNFRRAIRLFVDQKYAEYVTTKLTGRATAKT